METAVAPTPFPLIGLCVIMVRFQIFVIRAILGGMFAVVLTRFFYPDAKLPYVLGLGVILVGLAYFAEYLRHRKK
jgi:hypothetical protein